MTFGSPAWLFLLAAIPLLAALFHRGEARGKKLLTRIVAARLRESLTASLSTRRRRVRFALLLAGLACLVVAMAKPQHGYVWDQVKRKGRDVLIAIDTSKSMNANDLAPDRLTRAKFAAQDLMEQLPGDRLGLIAFAGTAFLQAPLTIDYSAVLTSLNELDTNVIPEGGTDISAAIGAAREAFGKGESEHRALIIFTDGEDLSEDAVKTARQVAGSIRIFTVGVGTSEGSLVPVRDEKGGTSFVKDPQGNFVKSRLDENRLREIAEATGGFYLRLANGPADMKAIVGRGLGGMKERDIDARESRRPIERYQWPLALGLLLLAASALVNERRRVPVRRGPGAAAALLAAIVFAPHPARAVNEGVSLYQKQKYPESLATFEKQLARRPDSPELQFDIGASAYKAGDYEKALQSFGAALTSPDAVLREKAQYNLGNTLYKRGAKQEAKEAKQREWANAVQHFDEVLKGNPANENAKFNRDAVRRAIEELKKEEQQQKQDQQNKKDDKQKKKDQQQSQQDQQKPQQDKQNQEKQNERAQKDTEQALQKQNEANKEQDRQKKEQRQQDANDAAKQAQQSVDKAAENKQQQQRQQQNQPSPAEKAADEMKQARDEQQKAEPQQGKPQEERDKAGQQAEQHLKNALDQLKEQQKQQQGEKSDQQKQQDQQQSGGEKNQQQQEQQAGQQGQPSPTPQPAEPQEQRKLSGDIKPQNEQKPEEKQQAVQAAEAAEKPGEMSERQAVMLLNSMKGEDANVSLREQKGSVPVLRDW